MTNHEVQGVSKLEEFAAYVKSTCSAGSNLPGSYVRALRYVSEMLTTYVQKYADLPPVWKIDSLELINELYAFVKGEERKGVSSVLAQTHFPKSYLKHRYYTNALKTFGRFISTLRREAKAISVFQTKDDALDVAQSVENLQIISPKFYLEDEVSITSREGRETLCLVKQRQNQDVFRRMILMNYGNQCCVTGLPVMEALRASHIVGWAENKALRLSPANGLCLSATYDAVFDKHLISFDEDYRMILSPSLHDYVSNRAFCEMFMKYEGVRIMAARRFQPSQEYLQHHREQMK